MIYLLCNFCFNKILIPEWKPKFLVRCSTLNTIAPSLLPFCSQCHQYLMSSFLKLAKAAHQYLMSRFFADFKKLRKTLLYKKALSKLSVGEIQNCQNTLTYIFSLTTFLFMSCFSQSSFFVSISLCMYIICIGYSGPLCWVSFRINLIQNIVALSPCILFSSPISISVFL